MRYRRKFHNKSARLFKKNTDSGDRVSASAESEPEPTALFEELETNLQAIRETLGNSTDIIIRNLPVGYEGNQSIAILYTDGLADQNIITDFIMKSVMLDIKLFDRADRKIALPSDAIQALKNYALTIGDIKDVSDFDALYQALLSGDTIILIDGHKQGIVCSTPGWKDRAVTEPSAENVVRGPRESFVESLRTNTALIRRKIKDPNLWLETMQIGRLTRTDVAIMYMKGIANDKLVQEVRDRLNRIDVGSIFESGYIEESIQDETFSPFPTIFNSERPDVIAAALAEGRVAILVDGTPIALIIPTLFSSFLQAPEDYYQRADISSFVRLLRYLGILVSLFGPSMYVAFTTFHQELLPTQLLISLAAQREQVPFPAFIEALLMELTFEILREASIRMPRNIGAAISIVGTLVIGQAAVQAGIVSAAMVIVVSFTAISSFILPSYNMSIAFRLLRFPYMALAASFGLFGIIAGVIVLVLHLCSLRSFGIPYMAPFAPLIPADNKDSIIRLPHWMLGSRVRLINQSNITRRNSTPPKKSRE
ncbi:MAG: spore germination protein [Paenibacillus macerans]|uniref:GerA spore germination family protein n=1 Tax=Paenibacillus macerans TaxID=44252 RepID=A0A090ZLU7_PAEMA|nr:spore germination protein [Paenibacillus macerans]KFN11562.1 GerA spore germination family protein [Paenibacillus macerans]MBS5913989.1 spore germination protein [Paenibacillus macerans]MCY7558938.1 spore germination protein [Paenibacillus macerans]MDU7475596.1 spore germination protein [Paenibacillus macerans]MEC0136656.1 spore germination protein [Paenibacillus macerans]